MYLRTVQIHIMSGQHIARTQNCTNVHRMTKKEFDDIF